MAEIIKSDGARVPTCPKNGKTFQLEEMQGIVGGYIETIRLLDGRVMVLNEEGKLKGLPVNHMATSVAGASIFTHDVLVGDVLVCESKEIE